MSPIDEALIAERKKTEHECFMSLYKGGASPFERPVYIDEETKEIRSLGWHVRRPGARSYIRLNYCPFCGWPPGRPAA
jgi:hypothetical protein